MVLTKLKKLKYWQGKRIPSTRRGSWSVLPSLQSEWSSVALLLAQEQLPLQHFNFLHWSCCRGLSHIFNTHCFYLLSWKTHLNVAGSCFLGPWPVSCWWCPRATGVVGRGRSCVLWGGRSLSHCVTHLCDLSCLEQAFWDYGGVVPWANHGWNLCYCVQSVSNHHLHHKRGWCRVGTGSLRLCIPNLVSHWCRAVIPVSNWSMEM